MVMQKLHAFWYFNISTVFIFHQMPNIKFSSFTRKLVFPVNCVAGLLKQLWRRLYQIMWDNLTSTIHGHFSHFLGHFNIDFVFYVQWSWHNITQHNTTQHNTTQHNTTQHNTTQHNTTQHNTTQHNTTQHNTTQHNTTQHNTTQHNTTQHNTTQHNTTQHNTTQHNTTQHNTTQHNIT